MSNDHYTTHQETIDKYNGVEKKVIEVPKENELDDIRRSLKYILDKLATMDLFLRSHTSSYTVKIVDEEKTKQNAVREFLLDMKAGKYTQEEILLLTKE